MDKIFEHIPILGVNAVFDQAQKTSSHEKLLKNLFTIFSNNSQSAFILEFLQCLATSMTYMEKQHPVENSLDFAAKYCIYHGSMVGEEDNILLLAVFEFIFDNHDRKHTPVRFRCCEFVNRLLNKMGPQAALDNDIFDKMTSTMLERLQDRTPSIRAQAVMALQRLQDPPNKHCRIIKAFAFHMEADPSCDVRARVVQSIAVTQWTLRLILDRLKDVKDTVRKEAYKALNRLKPQKFSIRQRQTILTTGLSDRSDLVKCYVKDTLIPNWFQLCNSDIIDFLSILDVVTFKSETLKNVLSHLYSMKMFPRAELIAVVEKLEADSLGKKVIPFKGLTPETAVLWSSAVHHLGFDDCEAKLLPELTQYAKYISMYTSESTLQAPDDQYILKQLVEIAKCYSFMDESGRKELTHTCIDTLKNDKVKTDVIPPITDLLELIVVNVKERITTMAELISDIREPLEQTTHIENDINWELNPTSTGENAGISLNDSVEIISEGLSQLKCDSIEECGRAERTDSATLIKCLTIIKEMLKCPSVNKVDAILLSLKDHFIVKCLTSTDGRVLSLACDALGLLCIWSLDISKDFFLKFCILIADDLVSVSALEAVIDILLVHGVEPFAFGSVSNNERSSTSSSDGGAVFSDESALDFSRDPTLTGGTRGLVALLTSLLKSHNLEVKCKASEGLSKLLLSSRIDSPIVLANLILLWFSPTTDKVPMIRQPLGVFFSVFSSKRVGAPDIILQAFVPTLRGSEELHEEALDQGKVANLFVTLLRTDIASKIGKEKGDNGSYHAQLALLILDEIRQELIPLQVLARALSSLLLEANDGIIGDQLSTQALRTHKWLSRRSGERRVLTILKKFSDEAENLQKKYEGKPSEKNADPADPQNVSVDCSMSSTCSASARNSRTGKRGRSSSLCKSTGKIDAHSTSSLQNGITEEKEIANVSQNGALPEISARTTQLEVIEETPPESQDSMEVQKNLSETKETLLNGDNTPVEVPSKQQTRHRKRGRHKKSSNSDKTLLQNQVVVEEMPASSENETPLEDPIERKRELDVIEESPPLGSNESSEDMIPPSPPKRRALRNRNK